MKEHLKIFKSVSNENRQTLYDARKNVMKQVLVAILWILLAGNLYSQGILGDDQDKSGDDYETQARGFLSETIYSSDGFNTVNLFSGNLVQAIPLGQEYPVGPSLNFSLTLHYNSNAWDFEEASCDANVGIPPTRKNGTFNMSVPAWNDNAGMGWRLSLGRLFEPDQRPQNRKGTQWVYESPDGARTALYQQLLPGIPNSTVFYNDPGAPIDDVLYSRNGTYIRVQSFVSGGCEDVTSNQHGCIQLEFPNGNRTEFHNLGSSAAPDWRPVRLGDPYGNYVTVTYNGSQWDIKDSLDREHTVFFEDSSYRKVTKVRVASVENTQAEYIFRYTNIPIARYRFHNDVVAPPSCFSGTVDDPLADSFGNGIASLNPAFLTKLELPDGGFFEFDYFTDDGTSSSGNLNDQKSGAMRKVRLPSGLYREFKYSSWNYTELWDQGLFLKQKNPINFAHGISEIRAYEHDADGNVINDRTTTYEALSPASDFFQHLTTQQRYAPADFADQSLITRPFCFTARKVTDPLGNYSVNYFQTARSGFLNWGSLPITFCDPQTGAWPGGSSMEPGEGPFLSREFYNAENKLLRSTWLKYKVIRGSVNPPFDKNAVKIQMITKYHDPVTKAVLAETTETYSDFDGLGNLRRREIDSDVPNSGDPKISITNYDVSQATVTFENNIFFDDNLGDGIADLGGLQPPSLTDPWILGLYNREEIRQGSQKTVSFTEFGRELTLPEDGPFTFGLVLKERTLAGESLQANDILTTYQYTPESKGRPTLKAIYGGDGQSVDHGNTFPDPGTLQPQYLERISYQHGEVSQREVLNCDGGSDLAQGSVFLNLETLTIDKNTGLVMTTTNENGVTTSLQYDQMNRIEMVQVPSMGVRWFEYQFPTVNNPNLPLSLTEKTCDTSSVSSPCSENAALTIEKRFFDRFGRVTKESRRLPTHLDTTNNPTSGWVERFHSYNDRDWILTSSIWVPEDIGGIIPETQFTDYDAFGRVGKTISPDGSETNVNYPSEVDWLSVTESTVQGQSDLLETGLREHKDGFGRLIAIEERIGENLWMITSYAYDQEDRLVAVCVNDSDFDASTCSTQKREFTFDGRGFRTKSVEPEIGTLNFRFNHAGNILSSISGDLSLPNAPRDPNLDTIYRYDRANRLTQVRDGNGRMLVENWYARTASPGEKNLGQLYLSKRHNYVPISAESDSLRDVVVSDTFSYAHGAGLLTSQETRSSSGAHFRWQANYDELGNLRTWDFPQSPSGTSPDAPVRGITHRYLDGLLIGIDGSQGEGSFISQLTYHPNGLLAGQRHRNDVEDYFDLDPLGYRLGAISVEKGHTLWETGAFGYDAQNNIFSIGPDTFAYDRLNRMLRGQVTTQFGQVEQQANFDRYGNITQITEVGAGSPRTIGVNQASNRLQGFSHDLVGNVTSLSVGGQDFDYTYDAKNKMTSLSENGQLKKAFLYNSAGNRVAILDLVSDRQDWTLRGADNKLSREFTFQKGKWSWKKDYINGAHGLIATIDDTGEQHVHLDHLGSTKLVTNSAGDIQERYDYFPFGGYTDPSQSLADESIQFTGHERDRVGSVPEADLDYMLARYYSSHFGRFLSTDPVGGSVGSSQSWNRYSYVRNNPIKSVDPDGREEDEPPTLAPIIEEVSAGISKAGAVYLTALAGEYKAAEHLDNVRISNVQARRSIEGSLPDITDRQALTKFRNAKKWVSVVKVGARLARGASVIGVFYELYQANEAINDFKAQLDTEISNIVHDQEAARQREEVERLKEMARQRQADSQNSSSLEAMTRQSAEERKRRAYYRRLYDKKEKR